MASRRRRRVDGVEGHDHAIAATVASMA